MPDEQPDVVVIGHVAIDVNVMPWGVIENRLGGAPTYAGLQLVTLKRNVGVVSKIGTDFVEKFPPIFSKLGLDTEGIMVSGEHTTTFENSYDEAGNRSQICKHMAPAITPEDVPAYYLDAQSFYISPIVNEVNPQLIRSVKKQGNLVMFDPQGLFRRVKSDGRVEVIPKNLEDFLRYVDVVKLGREEVQALKGDIRQILEGLRRAGPRIAIITRGEKPCALLSEEGFVEVKSLRVDVRDPTGAGDVFGAAFLARYSDTQDIVASARFASTAAGLKIRYRGPTGFPSEEEILKSLIQ